MSKKGKNQTSLLRETQAPEVQKEQTDKQAGVKVTGKTSADARRSCKFIKKKG